MVNNVEFLRTCLANKQESPQYMLTTTQTRRLQVYFSEKYKKWYLAIRSYKKGEERFQITYTILMEEPSAETFLRYAEDLANNCILLKENEYKVPSETKKVSTIIAKTCDVRVGTDIAPPAKFVPLQYFFSGFGELDDGELLQMDDGAFPLHMQFDPVQERKQKGVPMFYTWSTNDNKVSARFWFASDCKLDAYQHSASRMMDERVDANGRTVGYEISAHKAGLEPLRQRSTFLIEQTALYIMYRTLVRQHFCDREKCEMYHGAHPEGRLTMWIVDKEILLNDLLKSFYQIWDSEEYKEEVLFAFGAVNKYLCIFEPMEMRQKVAAFLSNPGALFRDDVYRYLSKNPETQAFTHNVRRAIEQVRPQFKLKPLKQHQAKKVSELIPGTSKVESQRSSPQPNVAAKSKATIKRSLFPEQGEPKVPKVTPEEETAIAAKSNDQVKLSLSIDPETMDPTFRVVEKAPTDQIDSFFKKLGTIGALDS